MKRIVGWYGANHRMIAIMAITLLILLAWMNRFVLDDAFISFRYAEHLAEGKGLVWNPGERIEGYTNFLWTLLISLCIWSGFEPVGTSYVLGILSAIVTFIVTYRLAFILFRSRGAALLTVILLGTNRTFSAFVTGGLETQLQTALIAVTSLSAISMVVLNRRTTHRYILLGVLSALAAAVHPDSLLLSIGIMAFPVLAGDPEHPSSGNRFRALTLIVVPFFLLLGAWAVWKLWYYHDILPNSFFVKAASGAAYSGGLRYISEFFSSYWLIPFPILGIFSYSAVLRKKNLPVLLIFVLLCLWMIYLIRVGGDFMEFRFVVPVLPYLFLWMIWLVREVLPWKSARIFCILLIVAGNIAHTGSFRYTEETRIEDIGMLKDHLTAPDENWIGIGKVLGNAFQNRDSVICATTACGAIPYYSGLVTVDMLGINDRWVARNGKIIGSRPGHQRFAPLSYLVDRRVNILLGPPVMTEDSIRTTPFPLLIADRNESFTGLPLLRIPVGNGYSVSAIYLTRSGLIDSVIAANGWKITAGSGEPGPASVRK